MFNKYYYLTKPGIVYGNAVVATGAFFLASRGTIDLLLLLSMLLGLSFVMASACVFNNYIDRKIDRKMTRTKSRALALGTITTQSSLIYATLLLVVGSSILGVFTNFLTLFIALIGVIFYVILYGIAKRKSVHGTLVGSISGAVPPVVGYTAVTNNFDIGAFILFLILVVWQMPHFYAIAIFRMKDYKAASIPVMPIVLGVKRTKITMLFYIVLFLGAVTLLTAFGYTGYLYLIAVLTLGTVWFIKGFNGIKKQDDEAWARKMFKFSLIVLMTFSLLISINIVLI